MSIHSPAAGQAWPVWALGEVGGVGIDEYSSCPKVLGAGHLGKRVGGTKALSHRENRVIRAGEASKSEVTQPLICNCRPTERLWAPRGPHLSALPPRLGSLRPHSTPPPPAFLFPVPNLLILSSPAFSYNPLGSLFSPSSSLPDASHVPLSDPGVPQPAPSPLRPIPPPPAPIRGPSPSGQN